MLCLHEAQRAFTMRSFLAYVRTRAEERRKEEAYRVYMAFLANNRNKRLQVEYKDAIAGKSRLPQRSLEEIKSDFVRRGLTIKKEEVRGNGNDTV